MARGSKSAVEQGDWVDRLADEVIADAERRHPGTPIVCASGLSPSGPIHLGNLREVMVPHLVADEIRRRGLPVGHILSWDDYDRFRKVPAGVEGVDDSWNEHIGKPLSAVPAPAGSDYPSWGEHFKAAMQASLADLGVEYRGISQTEQYTSGAYREQVLLAMRERARIDEILGRYRTKVTDESVVEAAGGAEGEQVDEAEALAAEGSGAASEDDGTGAGEYFPFKPYCHVCSRDTTRGVAYDESTTEFTYECECGHGQTMRLDSEFRGKLVWKVDWPMRWAYERVDFEPSGVDHQSPGSSYVVGKDIVADVFGGVRPIGPMYAFVGIAGMAKMSSSKGGVPTPADALQIMEPQLLRWMYARRRPNQSFQISFDAEIQRLYDEWDALGRKVAGPNAQPGDIAAHARAVGTAAGPLASTPVVLPYRAIASVADITGGNEQQMLRILAAMLPSDAPALDSLDPLRPRLDKAMTWVRTQLPEEDRTRVRAEPDTALLASLDASQNEALDLLVQHLEDDWSLDGLTSLVYGVPKMQAGLPMGEKKLPPEVKAAQRSLFALLYTLLIGSDTGPRLPTLLLSVGPERVRTLLAR